MLASFVSLNIGFSAGLQFVYGTTTINTIAACLALSIPVVAAALLIFTKDKLLFGEFTTHFHRHDYANQHYFTATLIFREVLGLLMGLTTQIEESTIVNFMVSLLFVIFAVGSTPYVKAYHNYRSAIDHIGFLVGLCLAMYYRSMKSTTLSKSRANY